MCISFVNSESEGFVVSLPVMGSDETKRNSQWDDEDKEEEPQEEKKKHEVGSKPKEHEKSNKTADDDGVVSDPLVEKLRQQRSVEEADYQNTSELFGIKSRGGVSLNDFIPKSEDDILEYAEMISRKIRPFERSFHYMTLLRALLRHSVASMKGSDAKEVASSMTAIVNEKLKAERKAAAGKKKTSTCIPISSVKLLKIVLKLYFLSEN